MTPALTCAKSHAHEGHQVKSVMPFAWEAGVVWEIVGRLGGRSSGDEHVGLFPTTSTKTVEDETGASTASRGSVRDPIAEGCKTNEPMRSSGACQNNLFGKLEAFMCKEDDILILFG